MIEPHFSTPPGFKEEYFRISKTSIGIIEHEVIKLKKNSISCYDTDFSYKRIMGLLDRLEKI